MLFSRQIQAYGQRDAIFIVYSTSDNSENNIRALEDTCCKDLVSIGFTGDHRGKLDALCNYLLAAPRSDTLKIQECHLVLGHILCGSADEEIYKVQN